MYARKTWFKAGFYVSTFEIIFRIWGDIIDIHCLNCLRRCERFCERFRRFTWAFWNRAIWSSIICHLTTNRITSYPHNFGLFSEFWYFWYWRSMNWCRIDIERKRRLSHSNKMLIFWKKHSHFNFSRIFSNYNIACNFISYDIASSESFHCHPRCQNIIF
jgi:hypothetical protein